MFGTILALFTGMFWTGQWCKDKQDEQKRRNHSRETNTSFYVDKQGRFRNTKTGKKMTSCDIKQTFFNEEEIKKRNEYYKKEYWGFKNYLDYDAPCYAVELFLTREEAEIYIIKIKSIMQNIIVNNPNDSYGNYLSFCLRSMSVGRYTQAYIDGLSNDPCWRGVFHKNF